MSDPLSEDGVHVVGDEELRASVFKFVEGLSKESGVDIDPEEVWTELMARRAKS